MSNDFYDYYEEIGISADEEDTTIYSESNLEGYSDWYKESVESRVWWIDKLDSMGEPMFGILTFSFDRKKIYNIFLDYPYNLTKEEKAIFDEDEPYWREFLKSRCK